MFSITSKLATDEVFGLDRRQNTGAAAGHKGVQL